MNKSRTKKKKAITFPLLLVVGMLLPANLSAQEQKGRPGGLFGSEGNVENYSFFGKGGSLFSWAIDEEDFGANEGNINVEDFGTPLGSGILVLLTAGVGYAALKSKKTKRNKQKQGEITMKRTCMMLVALALIFGLAQCKKNNEMNTTENEDEKVFITLDVNQDNGSKLDVDPPHVVFQNGDKIYVASNGVYVGYLEYNGTNFSGEISDATTGQPLYFYLLGNVTPAEALTLGSTTCSVVISDQTLNKPVIACNKSNENFGTTNTFTSTLRNKCALVKFNVTTSSDVATCITGFNNKVVVNFADNTLSSIKDNNGVITLPAGNGEKWAILLPQNALEAGAEGSAYSVNGNYTGTRGAVPVITSNGYLTEGIEVVVSMANDVHGDYVDLGLPSGTLWATCNVGADTPEDYGGHFAWGETQTKAIYNLSTYQYCNGGDYQFTKYCTISSQGYNGFTDNLIILLPEDDAATANWGAEWRMPTFNDWVELYQNTTCTWTNQNGVNGQLFTASNGNTLFLPAAGSRYESSLMAEDSYWSSSLNTNYPICAWYFRLGNVGMDCGGYTRFCGRSIRAVRSGSQHNAPMGAIDGIFSVSDTQRVYFSQGNLKYNKTASMWSFMEHQYDMVETDGQEVGESYVDQNIISLFGWGTSGYNHGAVCYQPWSTSQTWSDYKIYGQYNCNLYEQTGQADWGYNPISNGGNQANQWRTLTSSEWDYIFNTRTTISGIRYAKAKVNDVKGIILLPDDWSITYYSLNNTDRSNVSFNSNIITASQWSTLEQHGAVFLPTAGRRTGISISNVEMSGYYWTASCDEADNTYYVWFNDSYFIISQDQTRSWGRSVRLVQNYNY